MFSVPVLFFNGCWFGNAGGRYLCISSRTHFDPAMVSFLMSNNKMKAGIAAALICVAFILSAIPVFSQTDPAGNEQKIKKQRTKLITFPRFSDDVAWLDLTKGRYLLAAMAPAKVIGVRKVEADGFRFIPAMEPPEGLPPEAFMKFYRFSPLIKEIFIPYSEMKSVKFYYGITIRTKDGQKYHFRGTHFKRLAREMRSKLS
jgi:hypothetical protein